MQQSLRFEWKLPEASFFPDGMEVGVYLLRGVYTISPDELSFSEFQSRQFNRLFPAMPYLQPNQLQNIDKSLEFQFECFTPLIHLYL